MPQHNQLTTEMTLQGGMERLYAQMQAREVFQDSVSWEDIQPGHNNEVCIYWGPSQVHAATFIRKASVQFRVFSASILAPHIHMSRYRGPTITLPGTVLDMWGMNNIGNLTLLPQYIFHTPTVALKGQKQGASIFVPTNTIYTTDWFKPDTRTDYVWCFDIHGQNPSTFSVEVTVRLN
jgi:hypothetical protein